MNTKLHCKVNAILLLHFVVLFVISPTFLFQAKASDVVVDSRIEQINDNKLVTLNLKDASLKIIFQELQKQTDFNFVYKDEIISGLGLRTIQVDQKPIKDVLGQLFSNTNLTYSINGNTILILKKSTPSNTMINVKGKVVDSDKNPVVGATVLVINGETGTYDGKGNITDDNGLFSLSTTVGNKIEVTFVGLLTEIRTISATSEDLIIELKPEAMVIENVVVTGMFKRKAESYTGSSVTVTAKELKQYGNRDVLSTLRNIDPSFNILENNTIGSNPNRPPTVEIRGNSSIPNVDDFQLNAKVDLNTPLVILDGFEVTLQRFIDMNQNEIESVTLLKDASATAIYGSRGANGVIVVTSIAPKVGKIKLSYRGDISIEMPDLGSYDLLNGIEKLNLEYEIGRYDAKPKVASQAEKYAAADIRLKKYYNFLLSEVNSRGDVDWLSKPVRVGVGQRHDLRISGGDESFRYSASVQYNNTQGAMKGSTRDNFNGNITLSYNYKNLKFSNNLTIGLNEANESPYGPFSSYVKMNPYLHPYDRAGNLVKKMGVSPDPNVTGDLVETVTFQIQKTSQDNPLYDATLNTVDQSLSTLITNNFSLDWDIAEGLTFRGRLGLSKNSNELNKFFPAEHTMFNSDEYKTDDGIKRKGRYTATNGKGFGYEASLNLSYSKSFVEKHNLYTGIDYNINEKNNSSRGMIVEGFPNPELTFPAIALQYMESSSPLGSESKSRAIGLTGLINYTYDNRYFVDLSGRIDGSSAFGSNTRFAPFWSAGAGWNMHNEKFFENAKVINQFKVRGSIGVTGSQNFNPYQALTSFEYHKDDRYYIWSGASLKGIGNQNLKWQQKLSYNIGFDTKLFDNRLILRADVYEDITKDLISSIDVPLTTGFSSYTENIGSVKNNGFELSVTGVIVRNSDWYWSVTGSMAHNRNKITELSDAMKKAEKEFEDGKWRNMMPNLLYREGFSTNSIYVVKSVGIDPSTGKEVYLTKDGEMTYSWSRDDLVYCGVSEPKYRGNMNTIVKYKDFTLTGSFGYRFGGQKYNQTIIEKVENADYSWNVDRRAYYSRWRKIGDEAAFRGGITNSANSTRRTSRFVQDENTLTCQNISLMYELSNKQLRGKLGLENLAFTASMADVFYISNIKRERGTSYPFARQLSFTIRATF